jgi:hypothetical protein
LQICSRHFAGKCLQSEVCQPSRQTAGVCPSSGPMPRSPIFLIDLNLRGKKKLLCYSLSSSFHCSFSPLFHRIVPSLHRSSLSTLSSSSSSSYFFLLFHLIFIFIIIDPKMLKSAFSPNCGGGVTQMIQPAKDPKKGCYLGDISFFVRGGGGGFFFITGAFFLSCE